MEWSSSPYLKHLYVCVNQRQPGQVCCAARDSKRILERLKGYVKRHRLAGRVRVSSSGCMDLCAQGANVMVYPDHAWYQGVTPEDVDRIIGEQLEPLVSPVLRPSSLAPHPAPPAPEGPPIKAFLFDLGNVLVRFDHMAAARRITDHTAAEPEALFRLFFESPLVVEHDTGRISTRQFYERLQQRIPLNLPYERFRQAWNEIFTEDPGMTGLLKRLLGRYPCYLISNTNRPHFDYLRGICPVLERMDGWILSYEVGALKPDPVIYQRALELARLPAREILYIDDREDLIEAGHRYGFQTHRFTDLEGLTNLLAARGVTDER